MNHHRLPIQPELLRRYPAYTCVVVYTEGMDNTSPIEHSTGLLREAEHKAAVRFAGGNVSGHPHIAGVLTSLSGASRRNILVQLRRA